MKTFIRQIGLYTLLLIAAIWIVWHFVEKGLQTSHHPYFSVWNDMFQGKAPADILILGNSRAAAHIDPSVFHDSLKCDAYNLGLNDASFEFQWMRYQIWHEHHSAPDLIIWCIDHRTFFREMYPVNPLQFLPYLDESHIRKRLTDTPYPRHLLYLPFMRAMASPDMVIEGLGITKTLPEHAYGFEALHQTFDVAHEPFKHEPFILDSIAFWQFGLHMQQLREMDIPVLWVYTPQYYKFSQSVEWHDALLKTFEISAKEHDCLFWDYSTSELSFDALNFADARHLNMDGAEAFSRQLLHDLVNANLLGKKN
jgi:hypothetical protein